MKDCIGSPLKEGHFVMVKLGAEWVPAIIHKVEDGGVLLPAGKDVVRQTIDKIYIIVELNLADARSGASHPTIRRIPYPDREIIVPVTTKGSN